MTILKSLKFSLNYPRFIFFSADSPENPKWVDKKGYSTDYALEKAKEFSKNLTESKKDFIEKRTDLKLNVAKNIPERGDLNVPAYTVDMKEYRGKGFTHVLIDRLGKDKFKGKNLQLAYGYMFKQAPNDINDMREGDIIKVENGRMLVERDDESYIDVDIFPWPVNLGVDNQESDLNGGEVAAAVVPHLSADEFFEKVEVDEDQKQNVKELFAKLEIYFKKENNALLGKGKFWELIADKREKLFSEKSKDDPESILALYESLKELFDNSEEFFAAADIQENLPHQRLLFLASVRNLEHWGLKANEGPADGLQLNLREFGGSTLKSGVLFLGKLSDEGEKNWVKDRLAYAVVALRSIESEDLIDENFTDEAVKSDVLQRARELERR